MKRNKFNLSHYKLLTMDMGNLIPITHYEVLPGDTIQQSTASLIRCSPLLSPVMHPVMARIHHFFVPYRLIWDDWEDFITGGADGLQTPTHPYKNFTTTTESSLYDYLGHPPTLNSVNMSMLPSRAYQLIWNNYYRDQDLDTEAVINTASGIDNTTAGTLQKVCWEKDYFTTSRPWEQKGNTVTIPLFDTEAPVQSDGTSAYFTDGTNDTLLSTDSSSFVKGSSASMGSFKHGQNADVTKTGLETDLSGLTGIPVDDLRLALALQKYQEARANYGSRYVEYLRYLGVRSSDARLQNPEYLGGGRQVIQFSEVLSTDGSNTGDLKGHGISAMRTNRYRRFFEEHGIVMSLMSVIPKAIYSQAIHRSWIKDVKEEYFTKELQHIGQQEVYNKEVYANHTTPNGVFGYQNRYDEYRSIPSSIAGEFHSVNDHWHYARIHSSDPALNSTFIKATPTKRVNASTNTDCLYVMANHSVQARRMMSPKSTPKLVG